MRVEEKLEFFSKIAYKEAVDQKNKIAEKIAAEFDSAVAKATQEVEKQAAERMINESYKVEQVKNKEIIKATTDAKKAWIEQKNTLVNDLFGKVENRLRAFTETDEYRSLLIAKIKSELDKVSNVKVILTAGDMRYADEISGALQVAVEESREDFIGGFKLFLPDRNGYVDFSLGAWFDEEKKDFNLPGMRTYSVLHMQ